MGKNRRQERLRQRREQPATTTTAVRPSAKAVPAWRHNLDQWGGPWVLVVMVAVVGFLVWLAWTNRPVGVSGDELKGEAVTLGQATHVTGVEELQIPAGYPPAGGPHFINPIPGGIYDEPVEDGRAIHSLEHGLVWITYQPDQISEAQLQALKDIASDHRRDVILSPRAQNKDLTVLTSWGRRQIVDPTDSKAINAFISTNLNRSPEPAVR